MNLESIGWTSDWQNAFAPWEPEGYAPARISRENRGIYNVMTVSGERLAEVSGRLRHQSQSRRDFPAVGDWVAVEIPDKLSNCLIHGILPRHSAFVRRTAGTVSEEQVVAANIDKVFLISGLDNDFNLRRIERYLTLAYESGAEPVIILNKADLCEDIEQAQMQAESVAYGIPILLVSTLTGLGLETIMEHLQPGMTGALLGSSGVGKSSIVNALLGHNELKINTVREDDSKGRHTTTHRQLILLPGGSMLIDTPGMRELQLLANDSSLNQSFDEIAELAENCRFRDCSHTGEPGCAVQQALSEGRFDPARYESYLQQRKEIQHHRIEQDVHLQNEEKKRWKVIYKSLKNHPKYKGK